jgi:hypothetical protein
LYEGLKMRALVLVACVLVFSLMVSANTAHAFYDCVVKGAANSTLPVYKKDSREPKVIATVKPGSVFYTSHHVPFFDLLLLHKFDGKATFTEFGYMEAKYLDCDGNGTTAEYPIVIRSAHELTNAFGLVGDHDQKRNLQHEKNRCFWEGEADLDLSISDAFFAPYREKGFPIANLCLALKAGGEIRFDPETGTRMPTYVRLGTPFNDEYLLIVPSCLARGKFQKVNGSVTFARLRPIGCRLNFHPWSGRPLSRELAEALSKVFVLLVGGAAGVVNEDSKALAAQAPSRILSLAKINALREQMNKK